MYVALFVATDFPTLATVLHHGFIKDASDRLSTCIGYRHFGGYCGVEL